MIPTTYLSKLALFTNNQIVKVVVNGSYEIVSFSIKQVTASTVEMEYVIPFGSIEEVTLIELKSSEDVVISSNAVYVPITSDTIIKQTIVIKEV
ncbi:ketopantoate hydroxymethyltransferase [Paenibacillus sp. RC67]|uniref:ketopantoate hydroxymethyltransferase n=1 Tax=Paenibacillus sp. RC67 TaxID=3039392 RepID=UPI0024ADC7E5|nr:ketopantoate hydroxymethyltransferase [Paenibacillus sp. RC67]